MTMYQPCDVVHCHAQTREDISMCSSCIMRRGDVGCPHEHDRYDPSYIREFHMLVKDSCIRCRRTIWPDVFSWHDCH